MTAVEHHHHDATPEGMLDPVCGMSVDPLTAKNRAEVKAFYEAALKAGAKDNGGPGLRPQYHPNYYGAFVIDLNNHNIEAVCHSPEA